MCCNLGIPESQVPTVEVMSQCTVGELYKDRLAATVSEQSFNAILHVACVNESDYLTEEVALRIAEAHADTTATPA